MSKFCGSVASLYFNFPTIEVFQFLNRLKKDDDCSFVLRMYTCAEHSEFQGNPYKHMTALLLVAHSSILANEFLE